jgi:membrane protein DedA with SNARE-associated domain
MTEADIGAMIRDHGLLIIAPLAVLEGPVVSVVAGYLAKTGLIAMSQAFGVLVLADLLGDVILYGIGRRGRARVVRPWLSRLGVTRRRLAQVVRAFRAHGGRILVLGKLTHSAGFAVLLAAGMARMPFAKFLALNLLATLPKVAFFLGLGWWFGKVSDRMGNWVLGASILIAICVLVVIATRLVARRRSRE